MGTGRLFGLSSELWVRQRKVQDPAGKHHVVARFNSFSTVCFLGRLALPRGAAVLTVFFYVFKQPLRQKHAQDATSGLNEIFKNCQIIV